MGFGLDFFCSNLGPIEINRHLALMSISPHHKTNTYFGTLSCLGLGESQGCKKEMRVMNYY